MNFTNFTNNQQANQDLTLFYNWLLYLYNTLPNRDPISSCFGLSGQVAMALFSSELMVKNITFITNSIVIMNIIRGELYNNVKPKGVFHQKSNSYYIYNTVIVDVYYTDNAINFLEKGQYNFQNLQDIPNFLL
jgi:hypothetical protein